LVIPGGLAIRLDQVGQGILAKLTNFTRKSIAFWRRR